jgi:hypothetical protein
MAPDEYLEAIKNEYERATRLHGPFNSPHEGYGVLKEEVDELWDDIKNNRNAQSREEAIQVAAMCLRFLMDSEKWPRSPK